MEILVGAGRFISDTAAFAWTGYTATANNQMGKVTSDAGIFRKLSGSRWEAIGEFDVGCDLLYFRSYVEAGSHNAAGL